ncbi:MAG: AIPR family protein [Selenomonadaceae bacterium]|nr:AIPR family protein [Selenomonadaceae bacterium]
MKITKNKNYERIKDKIKDMRFNFSSIGLRTDEYIFSLLCVMVNFYKDPSNQLPENEFDDVVVDGTNDGGVDVLLIEPDSDNNNLIIGQSKLVMNISSEEIKNAVLKMATFYKDMCNCHYEQVNKQVKSRFLNLEFSDESKIKFILYTSAPKRTINIEKIKRIFYEQFLNSTNIELQIMFGNDIVEEIEASEAIKTDIDVDTLQIDSENNFLRYGDDAVIVNASVLSLKRLYSKYNIKLLSRNLRYHIEGGNIDKEIKDTIEKNQESFWFKNNGITIICDYFKVDGREVTLKKFSIVNGGQTVYILHKSENIDINNDFYIVCKIIKPVGKTDKEKIDFSLEVAKATNAQKAIKPMDLKANSSEQLTFAKTMRMFGVFYRTKRGENIPKQFKTDYLNTNLLGIGKLCLAAIFQLPCSSRTNPSLFLGKEYYDYIFKGNQKQVAQICKELLYMDYYFNKKFKPEFEAKIRKKNLSADFISFTYNARTICIAFTALAARYHQGNVTSKQLDVIYSIAKSEHDSIRDELCKTFRNLGDIQSLFPAKIIKDEELYDAKLHKLFEAIIDKGSEIYSWEANRNSKLTATNYLKNDKNYCKIINISWKNLSDTIEEVFSDIK